MWAFLLRKVLSLSREDNGATVAGGAHGRIDLPEMDGGGCNLGETVKDSGENAACHVLEKS